MAANIQRPPKWPVYQQVADDLAARIQDGEFGRSGKLPSSKQVAEQYDVGEVTATRALASLRDEGLVITNRKGTFVRQIPQIRRRAVMRYQRANREAEGNRGAFDAEIRSLGMTPRSDVSASRTTAPAGVAEVFDLDPQLENTVVMRRREMYADDVAVQLATSYIPGDIAFGTVLEQADTGPGGMLSRLADLGHAEVYLHESVSVRRATAEERAFLLLPGDAHVIEIWHVGWSSAWRPVEVCIHVVPAYLWVLDYDWSTE